MSERQSSSTIRERGASPITWYVVLFVVLLPLSINGHGLRELVMIGYFRFFRVGPDPVLAAVALSLTYVATDFITALPGGIIYLLLPRPDPSHETTKPRGMP